MMTYKINIECYGKHKKKILKHVTRSIFLNNRYKSGVNIEEEQMYKVSSDENLAVGQSIIIYDTRVFESEAESIDVRFDRFDKKVLSGAYLFVTITFEDETLDQKYACDEWCKLYDKLRKRIDLSINDRDYSVSLCKSYDNGVNWITIICKGDLLAIPLIYV